MKDNSEAYNENQILEGNELIAEFMKLKYNDYWLNILDKQNVLPTKDLLFYSSWDWLMSVVEKILAICSDMDEMERYYSIIDAIPDIQATWLAVVEFINRYNE